MSLSTPIRNLVRKLFLPPLLALCAISAVAATPVPVGEMVFVRNDVKGTSFDGGARQLNIGHPIDLGLSVATGQKSAARMSLAPQGALTLGASTQLTIDQPVVDRATGLSTSKLSLGVGWLRV